MSNEHLADISAHTATDTFSDMMGATATEWGSTLETILGVGAAAQPLTLLEEATQEQIDLAQANLTALQALGGMGAVPISTGGGGR